VRALAKLEQHAFPVTVVPEVQQAFSARAEHAPAATAARYHDLERALRDADFRAEFLREPHDAALVRHSLAITMLAGSSKENVYPETASAVLDLRLLPGADPEAVTAELAKAIDDPSITIDTVLSSRGHSAPLDTTLYHAIERLVARHYDGATVTPNVIAGFTDCNSFRSRGIVCYGFMPMNLPLAETARVHGRDERIKLDDLASGTVLLEELVRDVAARR
jgi:acetylornithine deacetylase/succinyl-diaminopimelate desuccinylase-like protein